MVVRIDMIRMLERDGWVLVTTVGSYRQFKHSSDPGRVTVGGGLVTTCQRELLRQ